MEFFDLALIATMSEELACEWLILDLELDPSFLAIETHGSFFLGVNIFC